MKSDVSQFTTTLSIIEESNQTHVLETLVLKNKENLFILILKESDMLSDRFNNCQYWASSSISEAVNDFS